MTESKYTEEEIIKALEVRMHDDEVSREAYHLIHRQAKELYEFSKRNALVLKKLDKLEGSLKDTYRTIRSNSIAELANAIVKDVIPHYDDVSIRLTFEIVEKAKALRAKEPDWL